MAFNFKTRIFKKKNKKENAYVNTSLTNNDSYTDVHLDEKSEHNYEEIKNVGQDTNHMKTGQQISTKSDERHDAHQTNPTYENTKQLTYKLQQNENDHRDSKQTCGPSTNESSSKMIQIGIGILALSWVGIASALVYVVIVKSQSTSSPCEGTGCLNNGTCIVSEENIVCKCIDGFSGRRCETTPCDNKICEHGGTCYLKAFRPECACPNGFDGDNCTITPCSSIPCLHNGSCVYTVNSSGYECTCQPGLSGENCQVSPCTSVPCLNNGQCEYSVNAPYYKCDCPGGFKGEKCEETPCKSNPCFNSGQCENSINFPFYKCNCLNGFSGERCNESPCDDITCLNYGHCEYSMNEPYHLCKCLKGSSGDICEVTQCNTSNPCLNHGECGHSLEYPYYQCNCQSGSSGPECEGTSCTSFPCQNNGICEYSLNDPYYKCKCLDGFSGKECEVTPCDSSPCENDSKCIVNGSGYICTCITECNGHDYTDYKCDADNYVNQTCFLDQDVWCDDTDWIRWQDNTPSFSTGPSSAAEGSFYFYVESSGIPYSSIARFVSKPLQTDNYKCLSFNYHMYGLTMGNLSVYQDNKQDWMKSRNQGNKWHFQQISILPYISRITFEALTGYGFESDIAIDNITITAGFC